MAQHSQFSPAQILEAGRRAEGQGQRDYALQFYRHLLAYHPTSSETREARDGIERLSGSRSPESLTRDAGSTGVPRTAPPSRNGAGYEPPRANGHAASHFNGSSAHAPADRLPSTPEPLGAQRDPVAGARAHQGLASLPSNAASRAVQLPRPARGYRVARALAGLTIALGALLTLAGVGGVGAALVLGGLPLTPLSAPMAIASGCAVLVMGLATVLVGQAASALFDTANATRELVAVMRALGSDAETHHRGDPIRRAN